MIGACAPQGFCSWQNEWLGNGFKATLSQTLQVIYMRTTLVKLLEQEADVSTLAEDNIAEYVQTKEMIATLTKTFIEPFKERIKEEAPGTVYTGKDIEVNYTVNQSPKYNSASSIVGMYEGFVRNVVANNKAGKQMYGVKRFGDQVAIDAEYLLGLIKSWKTEPIGENVRETITYKGQATKKIANEDKGKLTLVYENWSNEIQHPEDEEITTSAVRLYIAADQQVKQLNKRVIKPFEDAFKAQAHTEDEEVIFDNKVYGGLAVQVKSVPQFKPDYERMLSGIEADLDQAQQEVPNQKTVFYNDKLMAPKNYVATDWLLSMLENDYKPIGKNVLRQEINILYKPEEAVILSVE